METEALNNFRRLTSSLGFKLSLCPQFSDKGNHWAESTKILSGLSPTSRVGRWGAAARILHLSGGWNSQQWHPWQDGCGMLGYTAKGEHIFSKNAGRERGSQLLQEKQNMLGIQGN